MCRMWNLILTGALFNLLKSKYKNNISHPQHVDNHLLFLKKLPIPEKLSDYTTLQESPLFCPFLVGIPIQ